MSQEKSGNPAIESYNCKNATSSPVHFGSKYFLLLLKTWLRLKIVVFGVIDLIFYFIGKRCTYL
jgi:hypothetical protein